MLPVSVGNKTDNATLVALHAQVKGLRSVSEVPGPVSLKVDGRQSKRKLFAFEPIPGETRAIVRFHGQFDKGTDTVERIFTIAADGFPGGGSKSGTLKGFDSENHVIDMPAEWVP